uniref:Uncharacterized protein n=1 Tax=Brassica oleracea var. oleracea TaxID=109376 RepID=A0A0D3E606_BRAOL
MNHVTTPALSLLLSGTTSHQNSGSPLPLLLGTMSLTLSYLNRGTEISLISLPSLGKRRSTISGGNAMTVFTVELVGILVFCSRKSLPQSRIESQR